MTSRPSVPAGGPGGPQAGLQGMASGGPALHSLRFFSSGLSDSNYLLGPRQGPDQLRAHRKRPVKVSKSLPLPLLLISPNPHSQVPFWKAGCVGYSPAALWTPQGGPCLWWGGHISEGSLASPEGRASHPRRGGLHPGWGTPGQSLEGHGAPISGPSPAGVCLVTGGQHRA